MFDARFEPYGSTGARYGGRLGRGALASILVALAAACEDPQPPAMCGAIPQVTVNAGETSTVTACFNDPNGDMLTYSASSSNPSVATVSNSGATITITAVAPGNASVTVTATDVGGLQGQSSFQVTVPNRAPLPRGTIPSMTIAAGETGSFDASQYFTEPDGETLVYSAASSDPAIATVSVTGSSVAVMGTAKGTTTVAVMATDPGGLSATQSFPATVPNRPPVPVGTIPDETVATGDAITVDLPSYFRDPDGDELRYTARSSASGVVRTSVANGILTVTGVAKGAADVTVTATDSEGLSAMQAFQATVPNRPPAPLGTMPDETVDAGDAITVDLPSYFEDPDGDDLRFTARPSASGVVRTSVTGGILTITGVAKGMTNVTVTARDTEGLSATQTFGATVPNRPPTAVGTIPEETVQVGDAVRLNLSSYFVDPDGDTLTYTASASASGVVRTSVAGRILTVTGVAKGMTNVTVTATDTDELSATQTFQVTVPNRRPTPVSTIPQQTLETGGSTTFGVSRYFTDPDGDALTYSATSSNTNVASVSVSGSNVTITAGQAGSATVTVTARDPEGLTATQRVSVSVSQSNRAPQPVGTIPAQALDPGGSVPINVSQYFTDPDGDALTYTATSSSTNVATVSVLGSTVTITAVAAGSATITITARDPDGLFAIQRVGVTVSQSNRPPRPSGTVPIQNLSVGGSTAIDASQYFTDPDGDALTYTATTSNANVASASVSGSTVTIRALAPGSATITITAADPSGLTATQRVTVRVIAAPDLLFTNITPRTITVAPNDIFTVQFTVRNGGGAASAATTMRFYESVNSTISTGDRQLGNAPFAALAAGASRTVSSDFTVSATATGTFYLGACVDPVASESDTGNNCSSSVRVTVSTAGQADLTWLGISPKTVSVSSGTTFVVRDTLANIGTGSSSSTVVRFMRSPNATIDIGDTQMASTASSSLNAGESEVFRGTVAFTNTSGATVTVYVGFCADAVEEEEDDDNNCSDAVTVNVASASNAESGAIEDEAELSARPGRDVSERRVTGVTIRSVVEHPKPEKRERPQQDSGGS